MGKHGNKINFGGTEDIIGGVGRSPLALNVPNIMGPIDCMRQDNRAVTQLILHSLHYLLCTLKVAPIMEMDHTLLTPTYNSFYVL